MDGFYRGLVVAGKESRLEGNRVIFIVGKFFFH
jgi:hypothetical protein